MSSDSQNSELATGIGLDEDIIDFPIPQENNSFATDNNGQERLLLDSSKMHNKRVKHRSSHSVYSVTEHSYYHSKDAKECHLKVQQSTKEYKPILPEPISPDAVASEIFMNNPYPGKDVFRGRASFPTDDMVDKPQQQGSTRSHQNSVSNPNPQIADSARFSPAYIAGGQDHSSLSRSQVKFSADNMDIFPIKISLVSSPEQSDGSRTSQLRPRSSLTTSAQPMSNEEKEDLMAVSYVSIVGMTEKSTLMEVNGEQYSVPTRCVLSPNPENDWGHVTELMRSEFLAALREHAVGTAVKMFGGRTLSDEESTIAKPVQFTDRTAVKTDDNGTHTVSPLSIGEPGLELAGNSDVVSARTDNCPHSPAVSSTSRSIFVRHGIEGDGSVDSPIGRTLAPMHFTGSPTSITRAEPEIGEEGSLLSVQIQTHKRCGSETGFDWDPEELLRFTNDLRPALSIANIPQDDLVQLEQLIGQFLDEGQSPQSPENVNLALITWTRLDKVLEELIGMKRVSADYDGLVSKALALQNKWKQQFGGRYRLIDEDRFREMTASGVLRDMYCGFAGKTGRTIWMTEQNSHAVETEMTTGQWWPNMTCVYRDGFVNKIDELYTIGKYGEPILLLLKGQEEDGTTVGTYTYTFQSRKMFGSFGLVPESRKVFKVLKGSDLKSVYAPKAGIRYDGEYRFEIYGQEPRDHDAGESGTFQLHLIRLEGQKSMNFLRDIPTPAQMDEWKLYENHTKEAQVRGRTHGFFTHLLGKMARSPDVAPSKASKDVVGGELSFDLAFE